MNRLLGYKTVSQGPMTWLGEFRLHAKGSASTTVTAQGEIHLRGLWRLAEPLLAGEVRRGEAAELERLKRILETAS